eukprot:scaffold4323_cov57-Phaeocystis_antarctica.AAC.2
MSAVPPRLLGRSTLAPRFSSSLTISRWPLRAAACSRPKVVVRPSSVVEQSASTGPPLPSHLTTFYSSPRPADSWISTGSEAGELTAGSPASGGAAGEAVTGCGGAACCRMSSAVVVWPLTSACRGAVKPRLSSNSVLAPVRSSACTHASCPSWAATIRAVGVGRVPQEKKNDGGVAAVCSIHECGEAAVIEQLGVGLGAQQGLHACLLPFASGLHQGGLTVVVLQVGVGRVLQE